MGRKDQVGRRVCDVKVGMTEFSQDNQPQATPGIAGAIAPAPVELQIGVGALLGRLTSDDAAA